MPEVDVQTRDELYRRTLTYEIIEEATGGRGSEGPMQLSLPRGERAVDQDAVQQQGDVRRRLEGSLGGAHEE